MYCSLVRGPWWYFDTDHRVVGTKLGILVRENKTRHALDIPTNYDFYFLLLSYWKSMCIIFALMLMTKYWKPSWPRMLFALQVLKRRPESTRQRWRNRHAWCSHCICMLLPAIYLLCSTWDMAARIRQLEVDLSNWKIVLTCWALVISIFRMNTVKMFYVLR